MNFIIEDEGNNLSGGQKQRIAIARAIFHKKDLIVLDEATSALDLERENKILKDLHKDKKLTKIIISHKKNIRNYCNRVIEFKNIKISEFNLMNKIKLKKAPICLFVLIKVI